MLRCSFQHTYTAKSYRIPWRYSLVVHQQMCDCNTANITFKLLTHHADREIVAQSIFFSAIFRMIAWSDLQWWFGVSGHWPCQLWGTEARTSSTSNNKLFSSLPSCTKCTTANSMVLYSLSVVKRVTSTTRGVLSRLESTEIVFVFNRGCTPDPADGVTTLTFIPSQPGRG